MTKRILVVEDQEDNRRILRDLLRHAGFEVLEVGDGEKALTATAAHRPDVILMDIQLPLLDGYEATRRIKADPALKHIPIIVVTSYALGGDEAKARAAGCDAYIQASKVMSAIENVTSKAQDCVAKTIRDPFTGGGAAPRHRGQNYRHHSQRDR